jgi:hypothetical protein
MAPDTMADYSGHRPRAREKAEIRILDANTHKVEFPFFFSADDRMY